MVALFKDRSETLDEIAEQAMMFYGPAHPTREQLEASVTKDIQPALADLAACFAGVGEWGAESIMAAINAVMDKHKLKLPKIAMPLRVIVFGRTQTPNLGPVLALAGKKRVVERLQSHLDA